MIEINWNEWEQITKKEYRDILDGIETMWIMFHKGSEHQRGYYFKRMFSKLLREKK